MQPNGAAPGRAVILDRTRTYLRDNFLYMRPDTMLGEDDALLAGGVIDSIGVVELVAFLEEEFGLTIVEDEITEENLGTLSAITRFVQVRCSNNGNGTGPRTGQAA